MSLTIVDRERWPLVLDVETGYLRERDGEINTSRSLAIANTAEQLLDSWHSKRWDDPKQLTPLDLYGMADALDEGDQS